MTRKTLRVYEKKRVVSSHNKMSLVVSFRDILKSYGSLGGGFVWNDTLVRRFYVVVTYVLRCGGQAQTSVSQKVCVIYSFKSREKV